MPAQDTSFIKDRIVSFIERKGPSLPVHIAKDVGSSILFTSAFLSELFSEKRIKMSHMRIGSSPLYFIEGQEPLLEPFSSHLKSKERESFLLLKERKYLRDSEQQPAIRVAIRGINDFAVPYLKNKELFWKYFTATEEDFPFSDEKPKETVVFKEPLKETLVPEEKIKPIEEPKIVVVEKEKTKIKKVKKTVKKSPKKSDDGFFNRVKESLVSESAEILDIKDFKKNEIVLHIKEGDKEKVVIAFNKNKIDERDIINASKKAAEMGLPFKILSFGVPLKKVQELIDSVKNLSSIEKLK